MLGQLCVAAVLSFGLPKDQSIAAASAEVHALRPKDPRCDSTSECNQCDFEDDKQRDVGSKQGYTKPNGDYYTKPLTCECDKTGSADCDCAEYARAAVAILVYHVRSNKDSVVVRPSRGAEVAAQGRHHATTTTTAPSISCAASTAPT